jgi:hypothetical protein
MPRLWTDRCAAPLLGGRACRCKGKVAVRRLHLPGPYAEAPRRGRDGLTAGPADLCRHRAAELVHHGIHDHLWQIPRRQPEAQQAPPAKFEVKCVTSGTHRWAVLDEP